MPEHFDFNLNDPQYRAVLHTGSPLIVLAGPGSGKTRVIVHRIAHLIQHQGVEPESIVALTFTNKAAEEMRRRLAELLGSSSLAERVIASTFHSFCLRLIRQFGDMVGLCPEPTIIDDAQQRALMRQMLDEADVDNAGYLHDPYAAVPDALRFVALCRNHAIFPDDAEAYADDWQLVLDTTASERTEEEDLAATTLFTQFKNRIKLYRTFEHACRDRGFVTFDDLQAQVLQLLRDDERVRAIVRTEHRHLVIDEFQDVNRSQIELLKCLAGPTHDLCVVGDDDQAIYGFRGSIPGGFRHVSEHWPSTEVIELTQNYRSSSIIVSAADRIIATCSDRFKPDKVLEAAGDNAHVGLPIRGITYTGLDGAAPIIGRMIFDLVDRDIAAYRDCAILVRSNKDLGRAAAVLQAMDIPVDVPEQSTVLDNPYVQDVMSWIHILADPGDAAHVMRILARPPYSVELTTIAQWQRDYRIQNADRERLVSSAEENDECADVSPFVPFVDFLIQNKSDDERVAQFAGVHELLGGNIATASADEVMLAVINGTGMLTLDPVNEAEHQHRVEMLGRFLGFARERMPMLEAPRRIGEFLRYVHDLIAAGASMEVGQTTAAMLDSGVSLDDRDAVRILTAHKSKGLEFDYVFIPRVNSPHGYPMKPGGKKMHDLLPDALIEDPSPEADDDERRVFFVALTRAKKQAILLTMTKKDNGHNASPSVYWNDLIAPPDMHEDSIVPFEIQSTEEALAEIESRSSRAFASGWDSTGRSVSTSDEHPQAAIRQRERFRIRHEMYSLMQSLHTSDLTADRLQELTQRMIETALHLPILSATSPCEQESVLQHMPGEYRDTLQKYAESIDTRQPWYQHLPLPKPPLTLSYSDIDLYTRCHRCYWLRHVVGLSQPQTKGASIGSIVHKTLEFFYQRMQTAESGIELVTPPTLDDLIEIGKSCYQNARADDEAWSPKIDQQIADMLTQYHRRLHSDAINPIYIEKQVTFDFPHGEHVHRIKVRMDRVDCDEKGHHVVDYKTGSPSKAKLKPSSTDLQLGVYLLALQAFLEDDAPEGTAAYWLLSSCERGIINFSDVKLKNVRTKIGKVIDGILEGDWTPKANCPNCELLAGTATPSSDEAEAEISPGSTS